MGKFQDIKPTLDPKSRWCCPRWFHGWSGCLRVGCGWWRWWWWWWWWWMQMKNPLSCHEKMLMLLDDPLFWHKMGRIEPLFWSVFFELSRPLESWDFFTNVSDGTNPGSHPLDKQYVKPMDLRIPTYKKHSVPIGCRQSFHRTIGKIPRKCLVHNVVFFLCLYERPVHPWTLTLLCLLC